jgi:hypothetical protein
MATDENRDRAIFKVESEAGRFPTQMLLIPNVFEFSYWEYKGLLNTVFSSNADLFAALHKTKSLIADSNLDDPTKTGVLDLLQDEIEVVAYSHTARCSVISM